MKPASQPVFGTKHISSHQDLLFQRAFFSSLSVLFAGQGVRPSHLDQQQWAPLLYVVHSVAGTVIAMMNKLGLFKLEINYGVQSASVYLYNHELSTLKCFIDTNDEQNASRYYESYQCRMVAETVLRVTFMSMSVSKDVEEAVGHAISCLTRNAMHASLLPVLHERFIQRILQYEPLLGMATLGIELEAPVVSMQSMMQVWAICASPPLFCLCFVLRDMLS
jgi:hypothetical protein